ncbi:MAG: hypothetical protein ACRDG7_17960, partial [Candidatus Limnocylindria bacterium]
MLVQHAERELKRQAELLPRRTGSAVARACLLLRTDRGEPRIHRRDGRFGSPPPLPRSAEARHARRGRWLIARPQRGARRERPLVRGVVPDVSGGRLLRQAARLFRL